MNKINYQKQLDQILEGLQDKKPTLLLHIVAVHRVAVMFCRFIPIF